MVSYRIVVTADILKYDFYLTLPHNYRILDLLLELINLCIQEEECVLLYHNLVKYFDNHNTYDAAIQHRPGF